MTSESQPPAGWYPDPAGSGDERYWDGQGWSQVTRPSRNPSAAPQAIEQSVAGMRPAHWGWRVLAALIDAVVMMLPNALLTTLVAGNATARLQEWYLDYLERALQGRATGSELPPAELMTPVLIASLVAAVAFVIYRTVMVTMVGATVGQLVLGMRVVRDGDESLAKVGWGPSALRAALGVLLGNIPGLNIVNGLMPLFTAKKQTLHDMAARTLVAKK